MLTTAGVLSAGQEGRSGIFRLSGPARSSGPETCTDDIILDERRPQVARAQILGGVRASAARRRARSYRLRLIARDENAGVASAEVATGARRKIVTRRTLALRTRRGPRTLARTRAVRSPQPRLYIRVLDSEGNPLRLEARHHSSSPVALMRGLLWGREERQETLSVWRVSAEASRAGARS